jgi:hypothetical protein
MKNKKQIYFEEYGSFPDIKEAKDMVNKIFDRDQELFPLHILTINGPIIDEEIKEKLKNK